MYKAFYGLKEDPFAITPDPRFLYWSPKHQEAFRHLVYGIQGNKGLMALIGEPGTGKTAILHAITEHLRSAYSNIHIALLVNSKINVQDLFSLMFDAFHIKHQEWNKASYLIELKNFLLESHLRNEKIVIIFDEAQNFHPTILEEIRLLSNMETASEKLMHIILVGQPKLLTSINTPELDQLKQRLGIIYRLAPLNRLEMGLYIQKRLSVAGAHDVDLFTPDALDEIFAYSRGLPRLINILCDNALLFGFAAHTYHIQREIIQQVAQEMHVTLPGEGSAPGRVQGEALATPAAVPRPPAASGVPLSMPSPALPRRSLAAEKDNADHIVLKNAVFSAADWDEMLRSHEGDTPHHAGRFILITLVLLGLLAGIVGDQLGWWPLRATVSSAVEALAQQIRGRLETPVAPATLLEQGQGQTEDAGAQGALASAPARQAGRVVYVQDLTNPLVPGSTPTTVSAGQEGSGEPGGLEKKVLVVQAGDSLSKILLREYGEYSKPVLERVLEANPGLSINAPLMIGQRLLLPQRLP
ncbi:MAG: AAA family ATPase [Candidatus Tectimicrobiota bacterium]